MSGQNISEILNDETVKSENDFITAQDFLNSIAAKVNADMDKLINDDEYSIKEISSDEEKAKASESFKNFNIILQDKFLKKAKLNKQVKISMSAVRSILSAA
jgi:hypothetical protein